MSISVETGGSLADILDVCRPSISDSLIDAPHLAALTEACRRLPRAFAPFWGLECALGHPRAEADLLVEIKRDSPRHQLLAGPAPSALDALCRDFPAWSALRHFAQGWADGGDERRSHVRNVWVEFDLIAAARATPPFDALGHPSVFWGPDALERADWPVFDSLTEFVRARYAPFPQALPRASLEHGIATLPPGARVFQLGAMQSRGEVVLRLCVNRIQPSAMVEWVREQQWRGDVAALGAAVATVAPLVSQLALDVDYTAAGIGPKLGLECYLPWTDLDPVQWDPLLTRLAHGALCIDSKRAALQAFPAKTEFSTREQWAASEGGLIFPVVYRNIHHIKLSFAGDAFQEAKAYLGVTRPGVAIPTAIGEPDEWLSP